MHSIIVALAALIASASHDTPDIDLGDQQFFQLYSRDQVRACREIAMQHMYTVGQRWPITQQEQDALWAWKAEARYCYEVWNLLDDVQIYADKSKEITLRKLSELRDMLKEENYYAGRMPPPIPYWHLPRID